MSPCPYPATITITPRAPRTTSFMYDTMIWFVFFIPVLIFRFLFKNDDEDNSPKTFYDKNHQASSQKFRQLISSSIKRRAQLACARVSYYVFILFLQGSRMRASGTRTKFIPSPISS